MKKVKVLNVQFDVCTKEEALSRCMHYVSERSHEGGKQIVTPNPEMLLEADKKPAFREALNKAWLSIPDGIGILWASTFQMNARRRSRFIRFIKGFFSLAGVALMPSRLKKVFPERVTGVELMEALCEAGREKNLRIFLLGADDGIAARVKEILEKRYAGVEIAGTFSGSPRDDDFPRIHSLIAETQPSLLFVAFGSPAQELWIARHLKEFKSVKLAMGVGGAFDFIAGVRKRAPRWMRACGLEWLYRLIQEPRRFRRIWNATIRFPLRVIHSR